MSQKKYYPLLVTALLALFFTQCTNRSKRSSRGQVIDQKVDSLLSKMTLEEKVGQMTLFTSGMTTTGPTMRDDYKKLINQGKVGAVFNAFGTDYVRKLQKMAVENTRLGIPLLFGFDVIHGFRTVFPIPLGEAASWNPSIAEQSSRVAAREATAAGLQWTYAPMVDIARDPRWGRIAEGAGEDPYLGSKFAAARVRGFQGDRLSDSTTVVACVKHFAAYGAAIGGRDYNTVNMSKRLLWQVYLPPYKAALDAGVGSVMTSFNEYNGVPATGNKYLFDTILRDKWNFKGFVVTDYTAIPEMITHGYAAGKEDAAYKAIQANVDMDMQSGLYLSELPKLVKEGKVKESQINKSVRRILKMKYRLGLFADPYRYIDADREKQEILSEQNKEIARKAGRESIVLLKNKNSVLPLSKDIKDLAVIGPLADNKRELLGPWSGAGRGEDNVTVLQGIKDKLGNGTRIHYAQGTEMTGSSQSGFNKAIQAARQSDAAIVVLGEKASMSGEASSRATLDLPGNQQDLLKAVQKTGTPVIFVMMNGRPLTITWADAHVPAILETWFLGTETGNAIADVVFGDYNPAGKLPVTFPRTVGQVPYFYNHKNTGRPKDPDNKFTSKYIDVQNSPLYPFGYGLSYTTFDYSNLTLSTDSMSVDDTLKVSVDVQNTGDRTGKEVVQLYTRDMTGSVTRPVEELHGFQRITLNAGDKKSVSFNLTKEDFSFYNKDLNKVVEPGKFKIFVGTNSQKTMQDSLEIVD